MHACTLRNVRDVGCVRGCHSWLCHRKAGADGAVEERHKPLQLLLSCAILGQHLVDAGGLDIITFWPDYSSAILGQTRAGGWVDALPVHVHVHKQRRQSNPQHAAGEKSLLQHTHGTPAHATLHTLTHPTPYPHTPSPHLHVARVRGSAIEDLRSPPHTPHDLAQKRILHVGEPRAQVHTTQHVGLRSTQYRTHLAVCAMVCVCFNCASTSTPIQGACPRCTHRSVTRYLTRYLFHAWFIRYSSQHGAPIVRCEGLGYPQVPQPLALCEALELLYVGGDRPSLGTGGVGIEGCLLWVDMVLHKRLLGGCV